MESKISIRPKIEGISEIEHISDVEYFQNKTLRPIIKLQHQLLIAFYKEYIESRKADFSKLSKEEAIVFIEQSVSKDNRLKYKLIGMIIGLFTTEEFEEYNKESSKYNRRIFGIVKQRLTDSLQELI